MRLILFFPVAILLVIIYIYIYPKSQSRFSKQKKTATMTFNFFYLVNFNKQDYQVWDASYVFDDAKSLPNRSLAKCIIKILIFFLTYIFLK